MSASVRAGLRACAPDARAAVVALADQPFVGAGAIARLVGAVGGGARGGGGGAGRGVGAGAGERRVEAFESGARVAVATYGGEQRNPALFAREVWPLLKREMSG